MLFRSIGTETQGLVFRPGPRTRLLIGDDSARANVFFKALEVEKALEHMLDTRLRQPLEFRPELDWGSGLAASLTGQSLLYASANGGEGDRSAACRGMRSRRAARRR